MESLRYFSVAPGWVAAAGAVALGTLAGLPPAQAATRAVPQDYASLGAALAAATAGDSVLVSGGTYLERALRLPGGVTLRGLPGDPVIVDGQGRGRHLDVTAGGETVIESIRFQAGATPSREDPDGGSIRVAAGAHLTVLDCAFDTTSAFHRGGAIHCGQGVSLTLERCSFERAQAYQKLLANQERRTLQSRAATSNGGVIYLGAGGRLIARECRFADYQAKDSGGAIFLEDGAVARLSDCEFSAGTALSGAALAGEHSDVRLERCEVRGGVATRTFRGPSAGGAIHLTDGGELAVLDCTFADNRADQGGAIAVANLDRMQVTGSRFLRNFAGGGGAIFAAISPLGIEGTVFAGNNAGPGDGGAILAGGGPVTLRSSTFHGNAAGRAGSSIDISGPVAAQLDRCILAAGAGAPAIGANGSELELSCCNLHGNEAGDWVGDFADMAGRNGNLSVDPAFRSPGTGDFSLASGSPCLDARDCGRIGAAGGATP